MTEQEIEELVLELNKIEVGPPWALAHWAGAARWIQIAWCY